MKLPPNDNNKYFKDFIRCLTLALIIVFYLLSLTSCSVFKSLKKDTRTVTSDTTNVHKETEKINNVDTSKSKSTYSKETITFYPTRDTIVNNIYIPKGNTPYPVYITKETGTNETQNYSYMTKLTETIDSLNARMQRIEMSKQSETKGSLLSFGDLIGLSILGVVIIAMVVLFVWLTKKVNVVSQIIKSSKIQNT